MQSSRAALPPILRFYAKGVNCCTALREATESACSAAAHPCPQNALTMRCADLLPAISEAASSYPPELADWQCQAFPNDDMPRDSLIVALISLALALPVTIFLSGCFEIANDSEAPESWLRYSGITRFVCGLQSHRRWHYTGPKGQPNRFVRWYVRCVDVPMAETLMNLLHNARASVTGKPPPWVKQHAKSPAATGYLRGINMPACLGMLKREHKSPQTADAADKSTEPTIQVLVGGDDGLQAAQAPGAAAHENSKRITQLLMSDDDDLYLSADSGSAGWVSADLCLAPAQTAEAVDKCAEPTIQVLIGDEDGSQAALAVDECIEEAIEVLVGDYDDSLHAAETAETILESARQSIHVLTADENSLPAAQPAAGPIERRISQTIQLLVSEDVTLGAAHTAAADADHGKADDLSEELCFSGQVDNHAPDEFMDTAPTEDGADSSDDGADVKRSPAEEAMELRRLKRRLTALGLGGVLLIWAIMTWFILTYGLLIYEMFGLGVEGRSQTRGA